VVVDLVHRFVLCIKADRPLTRDMLNATDYWQTDNSKQTLLPLAELGKPSLISTCSAPLVQTWEQFFTVWPWPLTYDLDLQSQASQGQGRPSCQKSRSEVKRFKQESSHRQTDGHTHGRYQTYYLPCCAVDNEMVERVNEVMIMHIWSSCRL